jgi:hypothetical protein
VTARIGQAPGWWPSLVQALCDSCGWRGPVRDLTKGNGQVLAQLDRDEHTCGGAS